MPSCRGKRKNFLDDNVQRSCSRGFWSRALSAAVRATARSGTIAATDGPLEAIIVTGVGEAQSVRAAALLGVVDYVLKPAGLCAAGAGAGQAAIDRASTIMNDLDAVG